MRALFTQKVDLKEKNSKAKDSKESELNIKSLIAEFCSLDEKDILTEELYLYPTQKAELFGANKEYISAGRQDNLSMVHAALMALLRAEPKPWTQMLVFYDNEEIGSNTPQGADSPFAADLIERLIYNLGAVREDYYSILEKSFLLSADMAHAVHPNFSEEHDQNNRPLLNKGPVLKYNANQNYTTNAKTASVLLAKFSIKKWDKRLANNFRINNISGT